MNTQVIPDPAAVADYVARVRSALADLPREEVEELVQGMEADLTEVVQEGSGTLVERLGEPEAYAAELRSAAGLPEPPVETADTVGFWAREREALRSRKADFAADHPDLVATMDRLAPIWWVARGIGVAFIVGVVVGGSATIFAGLLAAVGVGFSVWAGLRRSRAGVGERRVWSLLGVVAVLALPFLLAVLVTNRFERVSVVGTAYQPQPGLVQNGGEITQLYAYDADGKRLDNVRIFDQNGQQVVAGTGGDLSRDVWTDASGMRWANVYPNRNGDGTGWSVTTPPEQMWHPPMAIDPLGANIGPAYDSDGTPPTEAVPPAPTPTTPTTQPTTKAVAPTTPTPKATPTR